MHTQWFWIAFHPLAVDSSDKTVFFVLYTRWIPTIKSRYYTKEIGLWNSQAYKLKARS